MPSDWLFYWITGPLGLLVIGAAIFGPWFLWRWILGEAFVQVGFRPLALAHLAAGLGLILSVFLWSYSEFSKRVSEGLLEESARWTTLLGWTVYGSVLSLILVVPLVGLVGVPLFAALARFNKLSVLSGSLALVSVWLTLSLAFGFSGQNEWHQADRIRAVLMYLGTMIQGVALIGVPFVATLIWNVRRRMRSEVANNPSLAVDGQRSTNSE
jgi:hypothetical protein